MMWRRPPFQQLELLGEGSQGSVYKALRIDRAGGLKQTVALKILHSKTAVDLWRQEFESLSRVRSPYCVQVLSFERYQGRPALVLEYVEGLSLSHFAKSAWIEDDEVLELLAQLEMGLKDLHKQGILHGDLSPQNILIDIHGQIRLLDFGLANCNTLRVTPQFAAPERLDGFPATEGSDIFSLGLLENFLRTSNSKPSAYLKSRKFQDLSPSITRQTLLAQKIQHLLERQKRDENLPTQTHTPTVQKTWASQPFVLATITSLLVLLIPRASHSVRPGAITILKVHTNQWYYLILNGRKLGYTPVEVPLEANHIYHLQWHSISGEGEKVLVVNQQSTLLLEDSDFSH